MTEREKRGHGEGRGWRGWRKGGVREEELGRGRRQAGLLLGGWYVLLPGRTVLQELVWVVPSESYEGAPVTVNICKQ